MNALRAETAAAVESVRAETLARLERMEEAPAEEARRRSAVESASLGRPSVESAAARVAAGLEPCVDAVTAVAARVLGPGRRRSGEDERERGGKGKILLTRPPSPPS